jgi:uncharacterized membrane protein
MKKQLFLILLLTLATNVFCQQTTNLAPAVKSDLLKKSNNQKTTAIILAAGGGLLATIGIITWGTGFSDAFSFDNPNSGASEMNTGNVLLASGGVLMLGSIPFFIASGSNKRKAMSISFKKEAMQQLQKSGFVNRSFPSLSLKISL